jgi:hypothetical protein
MFMHLHDFVVLVGKFIGKTKVIPCHGIFGVDTYGLLTDLNRLGWLVG